MTNNRNPNLGTGSMHICWQQASMLVRLARNAFFCAFEGLHLRASSMLAFG